METSEHSTIISPEVMGNTYNEELQQITDEGQNLLFDLLTNDCATVSDLGVIGDKEQILNSMCKMIVELEAIANYKGITITELTSGISDAINSIHNELQYNSSSQLKFAS